MKLKVGRKEVEVKENVVDRVVNFFSPVKGQKRLRARMMSAISGAYTGGSKRRRSLSEWKPGGGSADADLLPDLPTLAERSRDLIRNNPLAAGAINTKVTNVIGTGLKLTPSLDRDVLNLTEKQADAWEANTEREWRLFTETKECDLARGLNWDGLTGLAYRQAKENGEALAIMRRIKRGFTPYTLRIQLVEADRLANADIQPDTKCLAGGIRKDENGAPIEYHILKQHPGSKFGYSREWTKVPAYGAKTGLANVLHLYKPLRPGQSRGIPDLAPVIEPLKQLGRYTEAELMAAVVAGMFTVFIKTDSGEGELNPFEPTTESGGKSSDDDYKLGNGAIVGLAQGENIETADPKRPNTAFDPFTMAILRQIGTALELPFEILIKHFTKSYSAARAALLEAWKYFKSERKWITDYFCNPVYEIWMYEAVAIGRIAAPGFLTDPVIRRAYLGAEWIGPGKGMIDEKKEIEAAEKKVEMGVSTLKEVTAELVGGDWEKKHPQSVKEHNKRKKDGLTPSTSSGQAAAAVSVDPELSEKEKEKEEEAGDDEDPSTGSGQQED
ncbi:MAG TPA: phage portal protein [Nitrospirae bacterium]|nr:phage portal protein [Nitrospirota bacterium]